MEKEEIKDFRQERNLTQKQLAEDEDELAEPEEITPEIDDETGEIITDE